MLSFARAIRRFSAYYGTIIKIASIDDHFEKKRVIHLLQHLSFFVRGMFEHRNKARYWDYFNVLKHNFKSKWKLIGIKKKRTSSNVRYTWWWKLIFSFSFLSVVSNEVILKSSADNWAIVTMLWILFSNVDLFNHRDQDRLTIILLTREKVLCLPSRSPICFNL